MSDNLKLLGGLIMKKFILFSLLTILSLNACSQANGEKDAGKCPAKCCCELVYAEPHLEEGTLCHKGEVAVGWQDEKVMCSKLTVKCGVCPADK